MKYLFFALLLSATVHSQVGIATETPSPASMLDINSTLDGGTTYQGLMPPKIPLTADLTKINAGLTDVGLMVFVNETGCLKIWNGLAWEDIKCITVTSGTEVEFDVLSQSITEGAGGVSFDFAINNPSVTTALVVTIAPNSYADVDEISPAMVTIPAGATSYTATNVFNITDDSTTEGDEQVVFTITAASGGAGTPTIGANDDHTLTIVDNDGIMLALPFQESFETDGNGVRYVTSASESIGGTGNTDYFSRGEESDFGNVVLSGTMDGTYLFAAQDVDAATGGSSIQTLTITGIDITGGANLLFEVLLAEDDDGSNQDWDGNDFVHFDYQIDGTGYIPLLWVESENGTNHAPQIDNDFDQIGDGAIITDTWSDISRSIPTTGGTLDIRITINLDSGDEDIAIDNIRVTSN